MTATIARRQFIAALGGTAAWPLSARAQPGDRVRRVGVLMNAAASAGRSVGSALAPTVKYDIP